MTTMMEALHTEGVALRMEIEATDGSIDSTYPLSIATWLKVSNQCLRSDDYVSCRSTALLPSGEEVGIGSWTKVDATCQWKDGNPNKSEPMDIPDAPFLYGVSYE